MFLDLFLTQECLNKQDAGLLDAGPGTCYTVQRTLSPANVTLHDVADYVMLPPLDLSGSCGSGKQLKVMLSGRAPRVLYGRAMSLLHRLR